MPRRTAPGKTQAPKTSTIAKSYERTPLEQQAVNRVLERRRKAAPLPRMVVEMREKRGEKVAESRLKHHDEPTGYALLASAIALGDEGFYLGQIKSLANAANCQGTLDEDLLNQGISIVAGIQPKDHVEALLATQMAAVHIATMTTAGWLGNATRIESRAATEKAFSRLARTFAAQVESLKRHRSTGEQRVVVERVNVNDGGQAIVGTLTMGSAS